MKMKVKRKPAAQLNDIGAELYSVLSPQNGYMKILYGEPHFYDKLPRASASFTNITDAQCALDMAIVFLNKRIEEEKKHLAAGTARAGDYWIKKFNASLALAITAKIVKISVSEVVRITLRVSPN